MVAAVVVIGTALIRERLDPKYRPFVPNWGAAGLAFVIPAPQGYAFAMVFGAILAHFVQRYKPKFWDIHGFPIAAGLASGEACAGLPQAGLVIAGLDGDTVGTEIGVAWT